MTGAVPPPSAGTTAANAAPGGRSSISAYRTAVAVLAALLLAPVAANLARGGAPTEVPRDAGTTTLPITFAQARAQRLQLDFGPSCDRATGRVAVPSVYASPCVPRFRGDNGGATTQGVSQDTIIVALYQGAPDLQTQAVIAAGGAPDTPEQVQRTLQDYITLFEAHYETYGRKVKLVVVNASGGEGDDAAARADAIRVATEIKAFASFGGPTMTDAYAQELAARHVLCINCTLGTTDAVVQRAAPYLWGMLPTAEQANLMIADFVGKTLAGRDAMYAGDPTLAHRPRTFGLLSYDTPAGTFGPARDDLLRQLARSGATVASSGTYTLDVSRAQEIATSLITKLQAAGVTSIIFDGDPFAPIFLTRAAAAQHYQPEWIVTGSLLTDTSAFARNYDQSEWAHAFGISQLSGRVKEDDLEAYRMHQWQFGTPPPAAGQYPLLYPDAFLFFTGVHLAGPRLTPTSFRDAMWSYPPTGGSPTAAHVSFGRHGIWPHDDYLAFDDATEIWWDPQATGDDEIGRHGAGLYHYAAGGMRYLPGHVPSAFAPFADPQAPTVFTPAPSDRAPDYPSPVPTKASGAT